MWQRKYALALLKNLGVGDDLRGFPHWESVVRGRPHLHSITETRVRVHQKYPGIQPSMLLRWTG